MTVEELAKELEAGIVEKKNPIGDFISWEDLMKKEFPETLWIVKDLFPAGTIHMVSATPSTGKSWFMLELANAVSLGRPFLGKFETEPRGVVIVNEEDPERHVSSRLKMLCPPGVLPPPVMFACMRGIKLTDTTVDALIGMMKAEQLSVIIFDSLSTIHDADENSSQGMQKILDQMKRMNKEGITVLFTHHHRKTSQQPGMKDDSMEAARGSSVIGAVVDSHLKLAEIETEGEKFICASQAKLKNGRKLSNPFLIRINYTGNSATVEYVKEFEPKLDAFTKVKEKVSAVVTSSDVWLTKKNLAEMKLGSSDNVDRALKDLWMERRISVKERRQLRADDRVIPVVGRPPKANEKLYFRVTEDEMAEPITNIENLGI